MADKKVRFFCNICKKTITLNFTEDKQADFKKKANRWPYPLIYPHENHWVIVYLDENFMERGVITSQFLFEK